MTTNSPDPHSPIEPPEVDEVTERLSALLDGELDGPELVEIEQFAVDKETTIEELSAEMSASKNAVSALSPDLVLASTRSRHIDAALDAMDAPEVKSMAAARVKPRSDDMLGQVRAQRLNQRLRRLTAVAAAVTVIGGIGLLSVQGGLRGSDQDDEAASSSEESTGPASALQRTTVGGSTDDGSAAAESDQSDALAADDGSAVSGAQATTDNATDFAPSEPPEPIAIPESVELADATLFELPDEVLERSSIAPGSAAPVNETICFEAAAQLVPEDEIVEGITVQQGGNEYELVVLVNEELLVFELPRCVQVD